ncbi:MAG: protein-L-isoaspartate(D-aspartate) O-methyltransferase [Bacteroidota bacterium]
MNKYILLTFLISFSGKCEQDDQFASARERMVQDQIIARGVQDSATLYAMRMVPRHEFVPSALMNYAYDDTPLPIGSEQTISQPYIVALMTELIKPKKGQRILEVGTGSGYQAAVLAEIVKSVYTIEILPELAASSEERLKRLGYDNVVVRCGDGYEGWKEFAPFDGILVTAAAEDIPQPLIDQLKDGGILVIPVGSVMSVQSLTVVKKHGKDIETRTVLPVRFVPLIRSR